MNPGDKVQIRQSEYIPDGAVAQPPVKAGPRDHWLYATVLEITAAGPRVRVAHAGNRWHGEERIVDAEDVRTAGDVAALRDAALVPEERRALDVQAKALQPAKK